MKLKKLALSVSEAADVDDALGFDGHSGQRWLVSDRRDDQRARIFRSREAAIKQVIDTWCQQWPVFTI